MVKENGNYCMILGLYCSYLGIRTIKWKLFFSVVIGSEVYLEPPKPVGRGYIGIMNNIMKTTSQALGLGV